MSNNSIRSYSANVSSVCAVMCDKKKKSFSFLFFSVYFCCAVNVSLQFDKDFFEFACLYESNLFQFV